MVSSGRRVVLYHCFAGCPQDAIMEGLRTRRINNVRPNVEQVAPPAIADYRALALRLLQASQPAPRTLGERYLAHRCIEVAATFARFHSAAVTYDDGQKLCLPALVLPLYGASGFTCVQRIFLGRDGRKAEIEEPKKALGNPLDGAIRYGAVDDVLHLAEGFEDAASVRLMKRLSNCWAVCGIERYASVFIPATVRRIVIWSQHGKEPVRAIERAKAHLTATGRELSVEMPPPGLDWNEALCASRASV